MSCPPRDLQGSSLLACSPTVPGPAAAADTTTTTTTTTPTKTKAYYRVIRLDEREIARRYLTGRCTYCNEHGHARRACATGRLMRQVSKRTLDARLRSGVCPLCGDPDADRHSKFTCPQKRVLQASLSRSASDESSSNHLPKALPKARTDQRIRRLPRHSDSIKSKSKNKSKSKTCRRRVVPARPQVEVDCTRTMMDYGDTSHASTTSTTSTTSTGTPRPTASSAALFARRDEPLVQHYSWKDNQNLLDAEVTETVWQNIAMLPVAQSDQGTEGTTAVTDPGLHLDAVCEADDAYTDLVEDLIEF